MQTADLKKKVSVLLSDRKNRRRIVMLFSVFVLYTFVIAKIFAYFSSEDVSTNKFSTGSLGVELYEPNWDAIGKNMAAASEPGMTIPKDPYAENSGKTDLYIRLKMTVSLGKFDSEGKSLEYEADFNNNNRRLNSVLNAIQMKNGSTVAPLLAWTHIEGGIEEWVPATECNHPDFHMEAQEAETLNDGTVRQVFYFYYIAGEKNGDSSSMRLVMPEEATSKLFDQLVIPVYKKDYLGVFDQKFDIFIEAQAVPVEGGENNTISEQKSKFEEE